MSLLLVYSCRIPYDQLRLFTIHSTFPTKLIMLIRRFIFSFFILHTLTIITPAHGQDIETVMVNAIRKEQTLHQIPLSVAVVKADTLQTQNADHPAEALNLLPGVNLHRGSGAEHLTAIRSPVLIGGAGAGSFLYLQNGIPLRAAGFANTNGLLDAQTELATQIEVIRGPSGPIYGANAVHGVINVLTPKPGADNTNHIRLSLDSQNRYKASGVIHGQNEAHAWVSGIALTKENGYRDSAGIDQQKGFFRHTTKVSDTEIDTILSVHNLNQETAGFIFGKEALNDRDLRQENEFPDAYRNVKSVHLQSRIAKTLSGNHRIQITPFVRWHDMEFLQHFLPSQAIENNGHRSLGAQTDIHFSYTNWNLLTGVDVEYTEGYLTEVQNIETVFSYTQGVHYDYEVNATSAAGFVQAEYVFTEKLKATAGIRFDYTHNEYKNFTDDGIVGRFLRLADRSDTFNTTSPKIALQYNATQHVMAYTSLARGNRAPQTSDLYRLQINQTEDSVKAEEMDAIEFGVRYSDHNKITAHLAAYIMEKENYFFRDADGNNVNNGITHHRGIELNGDVRINDTLTLSSALTYARHTYEFDRDVSTESEAIRKGNDVDTAPRTFANTRLNWAVTNNLDIEAQWITMGKYYTDAANLHSYEGHDVFNLRLDYQINTRSTLSFSIRNLTDQLYAERADYAFGEERFFPAETRTVGLSLRVQM